MQLIFSSEKKVEGRKNNPNSWGRVKKNDKIKIIDEKTNESMIYTILDTRYYDSVQEYLEHEEIQNCLPGIKNINDGLYIYFDVIGWKLEDIEKYGIIAIQLNY